MVEKIVKKFWTPGKIRITVVILILIVLFVLIPIIAYNSFVTKSQDVNGKWSEIENQYQRQADLIPNLVAVVSSYANFETGLLNNLTALRSQWQASLSASTYNRDVTGVEMASALARLIAVAENYPELKANTQYTALSDELSGSQNRIAVARGRYIESIQSFNTAIKTFPNNVYTGLFGFSEKQYYQAPSGALTTPSLGNATLP